MSFLDQIEKLQKRPARSRERILVSSVIIIMILIVAVWIQTTRQNFMNSPVKSAENPIKTLWNAASEGFKSAMDQLEF
ncbi:MAG: hypothetical protein HYY55_02475 [Candidatus Niyogibacteria bacterium]|nr:MAG: hypothetical protein HYY55_02475 [Candidatus Niyogibacteria bacterium]